MNQDNTTIVKCSTCSASLRVAVAVSSVESCNEFERELNVKCLQLQASNRELTARCSELEASNRKLERDIVRLRNNETANLEKAVTVKEENIADQNENRAPIQKKAKRVQWQPLSTVNPNIDLKARHGTTRYNMRPR